MGLPTPLGLLGGLFDLSQLFEYASRCLPDLREGLLMPLTLWVGLLTPPGPPGGPPNLSWT